MNGVQTRLKCKPNVKQCKRLVFPARSALFNHNILNTKAISHFQANHILIRFVFPPLCGRLADQTVYVVRSGLFDKRMLPELQELYDSGKMKNMSILLNGIDYVKTGYGYGYGYGYGNYGNDENRKNKKPLYKRIFGI